MHTAFVNLHGGLHANNVPRLVPAIPPIEHDKVFGLLKAAVNATGNVSKSAIHWLTPNEIAIYLRRKCDTTELEQIFAELEARGATVRKYGK